MKFIYFIDSVEDEDKDEKERGRLRVLSIKNMMRIREEEKNKGGISVFTPSNEDSSLIPLSFLRTRAQLLSVMDTFN